MSSRVPAKLKQNGYPERFGLLTDVIMSCSKSLQLKKSLDYHDYSETYDS